MIGHTKAAAGVAGLIKAAMALNRRVLPPTIKVTRPLDTFATDGPIYVNTEARPWIAPADHDRRAALSAFGFGGSNFHCVLEEFPGIDAHGKEQTPDWCGQTLLLAISAETRDELKAKLSAFASERPWSQLRQEARASLRTFQGTQRCRLAIAIEKDRTPLAKLVAAVLAQLDKQPDAASWSLPDGVFFTGQSRQQSAVSLQEDKAMDGGTLAFLFPGQGSQAVGMLRDLACQFPQVLGALNESNAAFATSSAADVPGDDADEILGQRGRGDQDHHKRHRPASRRSNKLADRHEPGSEPDPNNLRPSPTEPSG